MHTFYVQAILTASLGGILYGYDMGVISGALPLLSSYFQLTSSQEEMIVSLLYFGGGVGAASGGFLCDWFGRKFAILITDVMFGLGAFWLYGAKTVNGVMFGRFVMGWAVAVSGIADVAYLHEISSVWDEKEENDADEVENGISISNDRRGLHAISPNEDGGIGSENDKKQQSHGGGERGGVVSVNEACISLGFLLAYAVAYLLPSRQEDLQQQQLQRLQEEQIQQNGEFGNNSIGIDTGNGDGEEAWRMMFAGGGVLALFQFFGMLCMPESPVWLDQMGRNNEARVVRQKIRGVKDIRAVIRSDARQFREFDREQSMGASSQTGLEMLSSSSSDPDRSAHSSSSFHMEEQSIYTQEKSRLFHSCSLNGFATYMTVMIRSFPSKIAIHYRKMMQEVIVPYKRQCIIAFFLATSQQFCGHPSILNYSPEIFQMLCPRYSNRGNAENENESNGGMSFNGGESIEFSPIQLTVGIGMLKFIVTCIVILRVEKTGRRVLLLSGMICIAVSLIFLWAAFAKEGFIIGVTQEDDEHYGDDLQQHRELTQGNQGNSSSLLNYLAILGIYGVAAGYAASYGPLTWLLTSEIFESSIRGRALGFATIVTYVAAGLVSRTFLSLQKAIGPAAPFAMYWISTALSVIFVYLAVPDTGGEKEAEEINRELDDMRFWGVFCGNRPNSHRKNGRRGGSAANLAWAVLGYGSGEDIAISPTPSQEEDATHSSQPDVPRSPNKKPASPSMTTLKTRRGVNGKIDSSPLQNGTLA